ncbi:TPA: hypothetical protein DCP77_01285 [Candidatus Collierbacteria bacterium]|uniref:Methyltransferase domain protein n=1 Tax=Candidatus Collierbacteria bacterium GW2011_GWA2_42_17 TaxID=1618378 RepID=A0A0G0Z2L7_9BACT|nr:MAG: Methyltransferase domain protein [Candidatus Collierbacteria bacterium GW2011_GWB2_42_12]KKS43035.1 MAG: Methyltransferase domain protein [Candidatus Collierbacteria bacterium GW2011_GWA2_42_17]KKS62917.1 MAG: Methyltransferase domain protein [Candidatus Collierbacteria bacterium GW2011_GWE2_42_48]KKS63464.1 MAG: Methyltransferase domain protein [Candidatus Collierbacteria bacterium GW2011_GWD2_42_50]KKS64540.1 MAG: Methyltransferase domain protein [Candidatus Collierbacteria bacterium 
MNKNFNWYKYNAKYYDQIDADGIPYDAIADTLTKIFRKNNVKTIVDLGCGTGNFYIPLAKQGFDLLGIDISADMLKIAKRKIIKNKLKPNLILSDIRDVITEKFDAAICLYNVIGDINYHDFSIVIKNMIDSIKSDGIICFDVINFENVKTFEFDNKYFIEKEFKSDKLHRLSRRTKQKLNKQDQTLEINQSVIIDGKLDKNTSNNKMYLYTLDQVTKLIESFGLRTKLMYGSYDNKHGIVSFKNNDPIIGVIAQKI